MPAEGVEMLSTQVARLDELVLQMDKVETISAPLEILDELRAAGPWKAAVTRSGKLAPLDSRASELAAAVKTLRTYMYQLAETSGRLGNLKGELHTLRTNAGPGRTVDDARGYMNRLIRGTFGPWGAQIDRITHQGTQPIATALPELADIVNTGCTTAKGGGAKLQELCTQARDRFAAAAAYFEQLRDTPGRIFTQTSSQFETQLAPLIDAEAQRTIDAVQAGISALQAGAGSAADAGSAAGSGAAAGSGSAAPRAP